MAGFSLSLVVATLAYAWFLQTLLATFAFMSNMNALLHPMVGQVLLAPYSVDDVGRHAADGGVEPLESAAMVRNLALMLVFAVPHSVLARPWCKRWLLDMFGKLVPRHMWRTVYVAISCAQLQVLMAGWAPCGEVLWDLQSNPAAVRALWGLFFVGVLLVVGATFIMRFPESHFDLFGLRQAWMGKSYVALPWATPVFPYTMVRHPQDMGFLMTFWSVPYMTTGHAVFSAVLTIYTLVAIQLEEQDLCTRFGEKYQRYQKNIPQICPFIRTGSLSK